ncbi:hypothetical protein Tco_0701488 [Tanacetum coccineum]
MNIHPITEPLTPTHVNAEENNNDQVEFTIPFCTPVQEVAESSSRHIGNSNMHTFNQPQDFRISMDKRSPVARLTSKMDMGLLEWSIEGRRVYVCTTRKGFMFSDHQKRYYLLREKLYLDCVKHGPPRAWIADSDGAEKQWRLYGFSALSLK